jgi:hypothetical protein
MALEGSKSVLSPGGRPKSPYGSFAGKPAAVVVAPVRTVGDLFQLDKGLPFQGVMTYLGPTLGWSQSWVRPERVYTTSPVNLTSRDSVALISALVSVTVNLPDVGAWMREPFYQIYSPFERAIWVKDIGGNAQGFPITIVPFGAQTIDGSITLTIIMNRGIARLYPRNDLLGWYSG